ncbi:unnamed protein product [Rhizophagus irregularis]|nr:unnamed protein product [Rhizophagus irregularis]
MEQLATLSIEDKFEEDLCEEEDEELIQKLFLFLETLYQIDHQQQERNICVWMEWEKIFLMKFDLIRQGLEKHIRKNLKISEFCRGKGLENEGDVNEMTLPRVSIVSRIDQTTTITLLLYHTKWLSNGITIAQSQWLFALLLRVDKLLTPNQMATLRQLCKKCIQIRQKTDEEDLITLASLDMIIIIVRKYFGQKDLL